MVPPPAARPYTDIAELNANRTGLVSEQQRRTIGAAARSSGCGSIIVLPIACALACMVAVSAAYVIGIGAPGALIFLAMPSFMFLMLGIGNMPRIRRTMGRAWCAWQARGELAGGEVISECGQILWRRGAYVAQTADRGLTHQGDLDLMPGRYRFYFLRRSGWLLSAEPLPRTAGEAAAGVQQALADALAFDAGALAANRAGHLTGRQAAGLLGVALMLGPLSALSFLFSWAMIGGAPWIVGTPKNASETAFAIMAALTLAAFGLFLAVPVAQRALDFLARRVLTLEDVVEGRKGQWSGGIEVGYHDYYFRTGGRRFAVPRAAYEALAHGLPYRVFYTAYSKTLVAIEPLTGRADRQ